MDGRLSVVGNGNGSSIWEVYWEVEVKIGWRVECGVWCGRECVVACCGGGDECSLVKCGVQSLMDCLCGVMWCAMWCGG